MPPAGRHSQVELRRIHEAKRSIAAATSGQGNNHARRAQLQGAKRVLGGSIGGAGGSSKRGGGTDAGSGTKGDQGGGPSSKLQRRG